MGVNQGYSYRLILDGNLRGQTVLTFLTQRFSHSSSIEWQERLAAGEIRLGELRASGNEELHSGQVLIWDRPGWDEPETPQHYGTLYCDEDLLAVDKPSGLPTMPGGGFYENTLLSLVRRDYPECKLLHRLGRATSGVVLFARTKMAASSIRKNWYFVVKQYRALAMHRATEELYDIQNPIGPTDHPRLGTIFAASTKGKSARSIAKVLERREDSTLFSVDLATGRPHQIRIHLACIGHPLVGDPLYEVGGAVKTVDPGLPGDAGYYLHAHSIQLVHPRSNENLSIVAELPKVLRSAKESISSAYTS